MLVIVCIKIRFLDIEMKVIAIPCLAVTKQQRKLWIYAWYKPIQLQKVTIYGEEAKEMQGHSMDQKVPEIKAFLKAYNVSALS